MATDTVLHEKREELKWRLASGEYKTLIDVVFEGVSRAIQRMTRTPRPISVWYCALVIYLVTGLIGLMAIVLLGEAPILLRSLEVMSPSFLATVLLVPFLPVASMAVVKIYMRNVYETLRSNTLDVVESVSTLDDMQRWLSSVCNIRNHLGFSVVLGVLVGLYVATSASVLAGFFYGFGITLFAILTNIQSATVLYLLFLFLALSARLGRYQLKLYSADPSSSEAISRLSSMLSGLVYLVAMYAVLQTFSSAVSATLTPYAIVVTILFWVPIIAMFVLNQTSLSSIIRRAKWKTLNEIQARVEQLHVADSLSEKDTMDAINRLMDYHDRIKGTRSSAFDLRAVLSLINSLLLPFLALLLANLDKVLALFQ